MIRRLGIASLRKKKTKNCSRMAKRLWMGMTNPMYLKSLRVVGCNAHFARFYLNVELQSFMERCVRTSCKALTGWSPSTTIVSTVFLRTKWCVQCPNFWGLHLNGVGSWQNPPNHIFSRLSQTPTITSQPAPCRCTQIHAAELGT